MPDITETPLCPFCSSPWTPAMLDELERHSSGAFCACCAKLPASGKQQTGPVLLPAHDLCCESCGKPIYRAPARAYSSSLIETADAKAAPP